MMNLAEYRRSNTRLADFLPWAALVDEGIVLNKDGSFQHTAKFRWPDLDSAMPAELVAVAGRLNNALRRLESGWAIFVEAQRHSAGSYPPNTFPEVASALVDAERRAQFEETGAHYESSYFLTFLYLPPAKLSDGRHDLRVLGYDNMSARNVGRWTGTLDTLNFGHTASLAQATLSSFAGGELWLDPNGPLPIAPEPSLDRLALLALATGFLPGARRTGPVRIPLGV